jgi:hypothetical protein
MDGMILRDTKHQGQYSQVGRITALKEESGDAKMQISTENCS